MTREELFASSLDQLEFHRVLEHIAGFASSSLGVEHLSEIAPGDDAETIRTDLRIVAELRAIVQSDENLPLDAIFDVREALAVARIGGAVLSAENLLHISSTFAALRKVRDFVAERRERFPALYTLTSPIHSNRLVEKHITDAIDDRGAVRDNASRDLARIRRDIIDRSAALRQRLQRILRKVSEEELLTDDFVTLREGRLVLPVRVENKRKIPGIIHGESQTGSTVFLEPAEIFDMNNEISELTFAERREVERILRTLTEEVGAEAASFLTSMERLRIVDSAMARARFAERYNCVEPTITDEREIRLVNARHPILMLRLDKVVPMSIDLSAKDHTVVISGPNAGGKTVAMKTLGLITAMTLAGIHPPAAECTVHPCAVFTDIGDQQSIENDLSTFSSHIGRIGQILHQVEEGDVVLLDEIGTGTDPDEGGAIAASILNDLVSRGAFVLATTHHSALKIFAYDTSGVRNAGMEFDTRTITPTYRFTLGIPGNSYAFEMIERLGLPDRVISGARARLGEERNRMSEIIKELEQSLVEAQRQSAEAERDRREAETVRTQLEEQQRTLKNQRQELVAEARREAKEILESANSMIENTVREIRAGADRDQVREMRKAISETRDHLQEEARKAAAASRPAFQTGDTVRMKGGTQIGEIASDVDEKGNVMVQFGTVRMRSNTADLEQVSRREARREGVGRRTVVNAENADVRVDLRGMYPDEAEARVEQAITAAINANVTVLELIHGKGTGVLRQRIQQFLRNHPSVESFRLGSMEEGGAGVTVAVLK